MDQKPEDWDWPEPKPEAGMDRRKFLAALGVAGAAGILLSKGDQSVNAAAQQYYFEDSFGNVVPAGDGAIALGVYPPPVLDPVQQRYRAELPVVSGCNRRFIHLAVRQTTR